MLNRAIVLGMTLAWLFSAPSVAQSVGDVASPDIEAQKGQVAWRYGFRPENDGFAEAQAQRLHVQWAPTGALHWRVGALFTQQSGAPLEFANAFGELNWQTHESEVAGFDSAFRLDVQLADLERSRNRVRIAWLAQRELGKGWQGRSNLGFARQFGRSATEDTIANLGLMLSRVLANKQRLGWEASGDTGTDFIQSGPVISGPIQGPWSYQAAMNFGISNTAPPAEFRVFINRAF